MPKLDTSRSGRIGAIWFKPVARDTVAFLAPHHYHYLFTAYGGRQENGGRWLLRSDRALALIARLRQCRQADA